MIKFVLFAAVFVFLNACSDSSPIKQSVDPVLKVPVVVIDETRQTLIDVLKQAERIPSTSGWFEIIKLPNGVYAFWEPGHVEKVNAYLIIGEIRDVLYDTGMGIASIKEAVNDVRKAENLPDKELMVVNSHNHLDHNGGNSDFSEAWIYDNKWGIQKLTQGVPGGKDAGFSSYWDQFTPHPGTRPPADFDPVEKFTAPFPRENIHLLTEGDIVDLGNRKFRVIHTVSHSPDGLALYDDEQKILFGGDTFYGPDYLITDLSLLAADLEKVSPLQVEWHYSSHGEQLIETMQHGLHLSIVRRLINGEGVESITSFAGFEMPIYQLDGVSVTLAGEILLY